MDKPEPRYVLYHGNCWDGFGAAWAAWRALGDRAQYLPVLYGQDPPDLPSDAIVALVDFSYPRQTLLDLRDRVALLQVLDHHKTAEADLAGLDWCLFDMEKSGATLAWEWWHPHSEPPLLIKYVQDRDLWRFDLPGSREVSAWLSSYPRDFAVWTTLAQTLESLLDEVRQEGGALLRYQAQQVEVMCQAARWAELGGYNVPVVNTSAFYSEVGDRLLTLHPDAPFSAYYMDRADGQRQWGLRSHGDFDVSDIAKLYGGGGHRNAAGFTVAAPPPLPRHSDPAWDSQ